MRNRVNISVAINEKSIVVLGVLYVCTFAFSKVFLNTESALAFAQTSTLHKVIYHLIFRICKLMYSAFGVAEIYILTNYLLKRNAITVTTRMIKLSSYCFGVYIFQQFILMPLVHNPEMVSLLGTYWLPWCAFLLALFGSITNNNKVIGILTFGDLTHYYDEIGLLKPTAMTDAGYRLYNDTALERLQHILLFRELEFPLKDIKEILDSPDFERNRALEQQIELLTMKKEHLENLILFARGIKLLGVKYMDFSAFDTKKLDEYAAQAKESWGKNEAYKEYEEKAKNWTEETEKNLEVQIMSLFAEFGEMKDLDPADEKVQAQVKKLQDYFTEHFYNCTPQILSGLGRMYAGGGEFTENIDSVAGKGTAEFVNRAIEIYCEK